jgi:dienelactone hydrolase
MPNYEAAFSGYDKFDFTAGPPGTHPPSKQWTRAVYRRGTGPAVIIIHEIPGLHPLVVRFADRVADAGMTVFLPSLFGEPGRPASIPYALGSMFNAICVHREFNIWSAGKSSPIVDWLRALARKAHAECGGKGVGAVGMCFTGGYALAMMTEPAVVAPVLSQPSMPMSLGAARSAGIDASPEEVACAKRRFRDEGLSMIGLRFKSDRAVRDARFETYRREFGDKFEAIELEDKDAKPAGQQPPHSVLTIHLKEDGPTKEAEQRVIAFFKKRTGA